MKKKRDVLAGRAPELQLLRGVRRYVESLGGNVVIIGGIQIQEWPEDPKYTYRVAVTVTGRKPTKKIAPRVSGNAGGVDAETQPKERAE